MCACSRHESRFFCAYTVIVVGPNSANKGFLSNPRLRVLPAGGDCRREVEICYTRGPDILAHARAPGNARRMHQVGHVGGERSLQGVPQER